MTGRVNISITICFMCVFLFAQVSTAENKPVSKDTVYEGKKLSGWLVQLRDLSLQRKRNAANVLGRIKDKSAVPALIDAMKNK